MRFGGNTKVCSLTTRYVFDLPYIGGGIMMLMIMMPTNIDYKALMDEVVKLARACADDDTPYAKFVSMVEKLAAGKKP